MKIFGAARGLVARAKETVAEYDASNPHTAGQVRQVVGGLLITDGLVGLENPFDGARTRPGILAHLAQLAFGLIFVAVGVTLFVTTSPQGDTVTQGTVTRVNSHQGDDGTTCSLEAEFWVDERPYKASTPHSSSGLCSENVGRTIDVRYEASNPANADIDDATFAWLTLIFAAAGAVVALPSLIGFAYSCAAILFGWRLVRTGRAMAAANPPTTTDTGIVAAVKDKFTETVLALRGRTTKAVAGGSASTSGLSPVEPPTLGPDGRPVAPAHIPAGWYRTADGASERWHDGVQWTVHVRPYAPAPPP
ncbi:DUF2510 domain-containing protein [Nocardioides daphniae]|uniref:DUF2510 domain-containing protein n=1 Tax=Nocardioides daphniae TaxID=402297 RepID=A0ABQ1Q5J9_9ACTN|nr:DUF3592 domain-containing protein [Nocardioides daphniae]GGD13006.1 hypothetical protein GCM10007231_10060 [Nocardioides daphniae]